MTAYSTAPHDRGGRAADRQRIYVIADLVPHPGILRLASKLSPTPATPSFAPPAPGLGSFDAGLLGENTGQPARHPVEHLHTRRRAATRGNAAADRRERGTRSAGCGWDPSSTPADAASRRPDSDLARPDIYFDPLTGPNCSAQRPHGQCHRPRKTTARAPGSYPLTTLPPSQQCAKTRRHPHDLAPAGVAATPQGPAEPTAGHSEATERHPSQPGCGPPATGSQCAPNSHSSALLAGGQRTMINRA